MTELRCKNCGGTEIIMKDNGKFICSSCGITYEKEQIDKMRVSIDGKVEVEGIASLDKLIKNGKTYLSLGEYENALNMFKRISQEYPEDYRGWEGIMKASLSMDVIPDLNVLNNLKQLAPVEIYSDIKREYSAKLNKIHQENTDFINAYIGYKKTNNDIRDFNSDNLSWLAYTGGFLIIVGVGSSFFYFSFLYIIMILIGILLIFLWAKVSKEKPIFQYNSINYSTIIPFMKKEMERQGIECGYSEKDSPEKRYRSLDHNILNELYEKIKKENKRLELIKSKLT